MGRIFGLVCVSVLLCANASAAQPAVVYDMGGKFDKSFNQSAHDGAERYAKQTGGKYREFEPTNDVQREQAMRRLAKRGAKTPLSRSDLTKPQRLKKSPKNFLI